MKRFAFAAGLLGALAAATALRAQTPTVSVVRDTGCGCCLNWVAQLRRAGFKTTVTESPNRAASSRVPTALRSCHTGAVDGYLIEGHVLVADITKLLQTHPKVLGIAAPGMPAGSPGMKCRAALSRRTMWSPTTRPGRRACSRPTADILGASRPASRLIASKATKRQAA
jgi:hypothetical protein